MDKIIYKKEVYDEATGSIKDVVLLSGPPSNGGNGGTPPPQDELIYLTPGFELGAKPAVGGRNPTVGTGSIVAWYTITKFANATRVDLELWIDNRDGDSGVGTGSYEVYLPDEIEPNVDWYVGHANAWISGGGISEFDGSVKWTLRNEEKGPKLIFTFDGKEWNPTWPKRYADLKIRANITYWL